MSTVEARTYTPDDLLAMPDGDRYELVNGELVEMNVSLLSSWVGGRLHALLSGFSESNDQGMVWPANTGCQFLPHSPNTVRKPDALFVHKSRVPPDWQSQAYLRIAPDLLAEVISPNDLAYEVDEKVMEYLRDGVRLIWVINPETKTVRVHRADGSYAWLNEGDVLDGENVLPGFRCRVSELFPATPAATTPAR
jgi:Uma2 family endonuclease